jgi:hypothetical protein
MRDHELRRALLNLDWSDVADEVRNRWRDWLTSPSAATSPASAETIAGSLGEYAMLIRTADAGLDAVIYRLNSAIRGEDFDASTLPWVCCMFG